MLLRFFMGCGTPSYPEGWVQGELEIRDTASQSGQDTTMSSEESNAGLIEWYGEFSSIEVGMEGFVEYVQFDDEENISCLIIFYAEETSMENDCSDCTLAFSFSPIVEIENEEACLLDTQHLEEPIFYGYGEERVFRKVENQWLSQGEGEWDEEEQFFWFSHE